MDKYLKLIQSVIPSFEKNNIGERFDKLGVDSFDLVVIRTEFENYLGKPISDTFWINFNSFYEVIQHCEEMLNHKK